MHNTVTIDGADQMQKVGRFLYLDRAQAKIVGYHFNEGEDIQISAEHDGYRRDGVILRRTVTAKVDGSWLIEDTAFPARRADQEAHLACLNWLVPDCNWAVNTVEDEATVQFDMRGGHIELQLSTKLTPGGDAGTMLQIVRSGELVYGVGEVKPTWGWISPTYGIKYPALALRLSVSSKLPLMIKSEWRFG